jgi:hypothetical protein
MPESLRGTFPLPDFAEMNAEIRRFDEAAKATDNVIAQRPATDIDLAGLKDLRIAAMNAMRAAENPRLSLRQFEDATDAVLDYLDVVESLGDRAPSAHRHLAASLQAKCDAVLHAPEQADFGGPLEMSDQEMDDVLKLAHRHEEDHKSAAKAYDKFRSQRKLSDGEKQRIVDRLSHMINLKPGMSDAKILVEMDALKERLDRRIVNFFKAGTATPEAIANLDEAMVLKMVLEEQIAKHNANSN